MVGAEKILLDVFIYFLVFFLVRIFSLEYEYLLWEGGSCPVLFFVSLVNHDNTRQNICGLFERNEIASAYGLKLRLSMLYLSEIYGPYAGGASMWSISTESGLHHQRPKKENILLHVQSPNRRYTSSKISILFFVDRWILYISHNEVRNGWISICFEICTSGSLSSSN